MIKIGADVSNEALASASRARHAILKNKVYSAENESDVRQAFLSLYDLDLIGNLEKHRIDYTHPELWLEMKYDVNMRDISTRCKIISQILHYLHYALSKREEFMLPESFGIVDKSYLILYKTVDFYHYIVEESFYKDIKSPSSSHPALERILSRDKIISANVLHTLRDYDRIWDEFNNRGLYDRLGDTYRV